MHEVCFAQADAAVEKQRVKGHRTAIGNAARRGMGQFVGLADDEMIEGTGLVERQAGQRQILATQRLGGGGRNLRQRSILPRLTHLSLGTGPLCRIRDPIDDEGQSTDDAAVRLDLPDDRVAEIAIDPVAHKVGLYVEGQNPVGQVGEPERLDPGHVIAVADLLFQGLANLAPFVMRHDVSHRPRSNHDTPPQGRHAHDPRPLGPRKCLLYRQTGEGISQDAMRTVIRLMRVAARFDITEPSARTAGVEAMNIPCFSQYEERGNLVLARRQSAPLRPPVVNRWTNIATDPKRAQQIKIVDSGIPHIESGGCGFGDIASL